MDKQDFIEIITGRKKKKDISIKRWINSSTLTYQYQQKLKTVAADLGKFLEKIL